MARTVLLTIGRLPKAVDFARSFAAQGWRVLVAEPFKSHLTGASNAVAQSFVVPAPKDGKQAYLAALAGLVEQERVDLVLPLSEETMHVAHLCTPAHVYAPPPKALLALHDKAAFIDLARAHGLPVPKTALLGTAEAQRIALECDYVIKPIYSCSGRGVSLHKTGSPLAAPMASDINARAIVQEQLKGRQVSTFAIAHEGRLLINVTYQGTIMSGSVAVAFERINEPPVEAWVHAFVHATGHSGFISFDFFIDHDGAARAIECNPRVTSGVHFVETIGLAQAITDPETATLSLKPTNRMMQFYPTLTEVQGNLYKKGGWARVQIMRASMDVTWASSDPMPFLTMPITAFPIIAKSIIQKKSFGEVSTDDISWFEGEVLNTS
jgi:predicted ATP-grasp superfamily ATP-dependent carboligase